MIDQRCADVNADAVTLRSASFSHVRRRTWMQSYM